MFHSSAFLADIRSRIIFLSATLFIISLSIDKLWNFSPASNVFQQNSKVIKLKPKNIFIELSTFAEAKVNCQLVYSTQLGKIVSTQGVIRDILLQQDIEIAVLENGLPIPTQNILSIQRMEG